MKVTIIRHTILFVVLIVSDIFIGFYGHFSGSGQTFEEYITTLTFNDLAPVLLVAFIVMFTVEVLFRRWKTG